MAKRTASDSSAAAESARRLDTLLNNLPGMAYRCCNDRSYTMQFVSAGALALTGYRADELEQSQGVTYGALIHPDDQAKVWEQVQASVAAAQPFNLRYRIRTASGAEKWVEERGCGIFAADGSLAALEGYISDITAAAAEEALLEHERTMQGLLDAILDSVLLIDAEGVILYANATVGQRLGVAAAEMVGCSLYDLLPAEVAARRRAYVEHVRRVRQHFTFLDQRGDHWIEHNYYPICDAQGEVARLAIYGRDVTEKHRAEEALRYNEERYRMLAENASDVIVTVNPRGEVTYVSPSVRQVLGYTEAEMKAISITAICRPESCALAFQTYAEASAHPGSRVRTLELECWHSNGALVTLEVSMKVLCDAAGDPVSVIAIARDITARKNVEALLYASEQQLRALVGNSPDIIARFDRDLRHLFVSRAIEPVTGMPAAAMFGKTDRELGMPAAQVEYWEERLRHVFATGETTDIEFSLPTPAGVEYFTSRLIPEYSAQEEIQTVLGVTRNITARRRAELALQESEKRYRQIIETAQEGIWMIDPAANTTFVNQAMATMLGYAVAEMAGTPLFAFMDEEGRALAHHNLARRQQGISENHEFKFVRKDGQPVWAYLSTNPILDDAGHYQGALAMVTDITERKQAEIELAQRAADLERSNRDLEQFAYVASHDLQEPLRMVASFVQLLAQEYRGQLGENADEYIDYAVEGAKRMRQIIADLLAYSRVSTHGKPFLPVDCNTVLEEVLASLQLVIEENGGQVAYDGLPAVLGDRTQIYQVFQNLIGNAFKYCSAAPPRIAVGAAPAPGGKMWRFWVSDNGIGIEPQYFERIFVIFQRLHGRKEYSGTGVGLAICKKIVERHGGRIWVESTPGEGSTFHFTLPAADETAAEQAEG